jgi:hypothetical protein
MYKKDVKKGMTQNRKFIFNISYEEVKWQINGLNMLNQ